VIIDDGGEQRRGAMVVGALPAPKPWTRDPHCSVCDRSRVPSTIDTRWKKRQARSPLHCAGDDCRCRNEMMQHRQSSSGASKTGVHRAAAQRGCAVDCQPAAGTLACVEPAADQAGQLRLMVLFVDADHDGGNVLSHRGDGHRGLIPPVVDRAMPTRSKTMTTCPHQRCCLASG